MVADTTKGIRDQVSIDTLDHPRSTLDRHLDRYSIENQSTLNRHSINIVVDNRSSVHRLICRKFSESPPGQRHATDSQPVDRMAADMPIESRPLVHMIQKTIREPNFFRQIIFHSLGVHLFIICNFTTCVKLLSP